MGHRLVYALTPIILATLMLLTSFTLWPMRAAFALSRNSFATLSQRVLAGEKIATPAYVGSFRIEKTELSPEGIVCFWTSPSPGGNTGFIQTAPDHVPFNLWSMTSLDTQWQFITED